MDTFREYCARKASTLWNDAFGTCVHPNSDEDEGNSRITDTYHRITEFRGEIEEPQEIINVPWDSVPIPEDDLQEKLYHARRENAFLLKQVDDKVLETERLIEKHLKQKEEVANARKELAELIAVKERNMRLLEKKNEEIRLLLATLANLEQQEDSDSDYVSGDNSDNSNEDNSDDNSSLYLPDD